MSEQLIISLNKARFFAFHGLYEAEKKIGNEFEVSLSVTRDVQVALITELDQTLDYAALYELLKKEMQKPRALLETLAMELAELIHTRFTCINQVEVEIVKLCLPVEQHTGSASIRYKKSF